MQFVTNGVIFFNIYVPFRAAAVQNTQRRIKRSYISKIHTKVELLYGSMVSEIRFSHNNNYFRINDLYLFFFPTAVF
jgi:hypothetical protein